VHVAVREMQAVFMKAVAEKEWKRKKMYLIDVKFSIETKLATTPERQTLQNSDEKQYCEYWILRLVVYTRFPAKPLLVEALNVR